MDPRCRSHQLLASPVVFLALFTHSHQVPASPVFFLALFARAQSRLRLRLAIVLGLYWAGAGQQAGQTTHGENWDNLLVNFPLIMGP